MLQCNFACSLSFSPSCLDRAVCVTRTHKHQISIRFPLIASANSIDTKYTTKATTTIIRILFTVNCMFEIERLVNTINNTQDRRTRERTSENREQRRKKHSQPPIVIYNYTIRHVELTQPIYRHECISSVLLSRVTFVLRFANTGAQFVSVAFVGCCC